MGILGIIALILRVITLMPSLIKVGMAIIALLPKFKDGGFWNDLKVIGEILRLILGLIPLNRDGAKISLIELKDHLENPHLMGGSLGLEDLKDRVERRASTVSDSMNTVKD